MEEPIFLDNMIFVTNKQCLDLKPNWDVDIGDGLYLHKDYLAELVADEFERQMHP